MKKILICCGFALLSLAACKKDKPVVLSAFDKLTYADILASDGQGALTATTIAVQNANTSYALNVGAILIYQTTAGTYGKLLIVDNGSNNAAHSLIFNLVNYKADGTVLFQKQNAQVDLGYNVDLDLGTQTMADGNQTFYYSALGDGSKGIYPDLNGNMGLYAN
ncbi:MAG: hypothetical protein ACKOWL_02925 [Sphingobacteriaceae bacterium]